MRIHIRTPNEGMIPLDVESSSTVAQLREAVTNHLRRGYEGRYGNMTEGQLRLIYKGRVLNVEQTLPDANLTEDQTVHLVIRQLDAGADLTGTNQGAPIPASEASPQSSEGQQDPSQEQQSPFHQAFQQAAAAAGPQAMSFIMSQLGNLAQPATQSVLFASLPSAMRLGGDLPFGLSGRGRGASATTATPTSTGAATNTSSSNQATGSIASPTGQNMTSESASSTNAAQPTSNVQPSAVPTVTQNYHGTVNHNHYYGSNGSPSDSSNSVRVHLDVTVDELELVPEAVGRFKTRMTLSTNDDNIRRPVQSNAGDSRFLPQLHIHTSLAELERLPDALYRLQSRMGDAVDVRTADIEMNVNHSQ